MNPSPQKTRIAIVGGGPAALFLYQALIKTGSTNFTVDIFETKNILGEGFPYSKEGADVEHITNVSGNEIPKLVTPFVDWLKSLPAEKLQHYNIDAGRFTAYKVFPRLLFGE